MTKGIMLIVFGILILSIGIFTFKKPTFGWRMSEGWKVEGDPEPSRAYIDYQKFVGVVTIMIGSVITLLGILALL